MISFVCMQVFILERHVETQLVAKSDASIDTFEYLGYPVFLKKYPLQRTDSVTSMSYLPTLVGGIRYVANAVLAKSSRT